jgi:hypothetical protein
MVVLLVGRAVIMDENRESRKAGQGEPAFPFFEVYPGATFGERCVLGLEDRFQVTVDIYILCASASLSTISVFFSSLLQQIWTTHTFDIRHYFNIFKDFFFFFSCVMNHLFIH